MWTSLWNLTLFTEPPNTSTLTLPRSYTLVSFILDPVSLPTSPQWSSSPLLLQGLSTSHEGSPPLLDIKSCYEPMLIR